VLSRPVNDLLEGFLKVRRQLKAKQGRNKRVALSQLNSLICVKWAWSECVPKSVRQLSTLS